MASVVISGDTSGSVTLSAPAVAGTTTLTLPSTSGTVLTTASTTGISGSAISTGTVAEAYGGTGTSTGYYGFKNRIINGAFGIWQRGTSGAMTTSPTYVAADRWGVDQASSAVATFSQSTSVPTAVAQYSGKVQRNNASTGTNNIVIAQAFETANSYDLAGQSATLSFYAKAGANFSASSNTLNFNVFYGQGTDQSLASMRSNSWTNQTNSGSSVSLTTTWTKYTFTVSVPAGTTQVGLQFYFTPVGTAGADDAFYITGVQLEKGSTATSFDYRPYGTELQLCQRYYESTAFPDVSFGIGAVRVTVSTATTSYANGFSYLVPKRTNSPTVTLYSRNGNSGKASLVSNGADIANTSTANNIGGTGFWGVALGVQQTAGTGIEVGWTASAEL